MGDARRRGSYDERRRVAVKRNKELLTRHMGDKDERADIALRAGLEPFLQRMSADEWLNRRQHIFNTLKGVMQGDLLSAAKPVRVRDDEIGWYLFLCEQALNDPLCMEISQAQRALPFIAGIGERWDHASKVKGLERKIDELLHAYKASPDGLIFEILVALSYAEAGWDVELLEEKPPAKSPDMVARKAGKVLYIECKRQDRRVAYSEVERNEFLRLWDAATKVLVHHGQWIWFKGVFHADPSSLSTDFLKNIFEASLPISAGEQVIHDDADATISARLIDQYFVRKHFENNRVKLNSPLLSSLLGGDWAPMNSAVSILHLVKRSHVSDCEAPVLGTYIDEVSWACGFTREFDSEYSIDKKAKDVTKHLADAVKQVPDDAPSIIHLAAETMEGKDVERRRNEKVFRTIPSFITNKPVVAVRFHRFLSNQRTDKLYEFDETVDKFQDGRIDLSDIPHSVVVPNDTEMRSGTHWELYP